MTTIEYNQCVDEFSDNVFRFILKNIRDEDKAKDIVQDSFVKMWDKVKSVDFKKAKSYLFTTAYHTMIDQTRKDNKLSKFEEAPLNSFSHESSYSDLSEILNEAADKLPEIQKSVILLRDYEGYSYKEIGKITGLSESQVKVYIYRARLSMKKFLVSIEKVI